MVTVIDFPASVPVAHPRFWLHSDTGGERGLDGRESVVFTENRYWVGNITLPHLTQAQAMQVLACCDALRGRARALRLPVTNFGTLTDPGSDAAFWDLIGVPDAHVGAGFEPFSDGTNFTDGTGFALPDRGPVTVFEAAPVGASTVRVTGYIGRHLAVGAGFSINDFFYRVEANSDGRLTFNPPLREAVEIGDPVEVTAPKIRVRLSDPRQMRLDVEYGVFGRPLSFDVDEVFER